MTANEIITKCDRLKPNNYSYAQKTEWLGNAEADIIKTLNLFSESKMQSGFTSSDNPTLCLADENSDIYLYYLISMIDLSNQEYDLYNNSCAYYNHLLSTWKKSVRRNNLPHCNICVKV